MKNRLRQIVIAVSFLSLGSLALNAQQQRIARDLESPEAASTVDVIVQYRGGVTRQHRSRVVARGGRIKARLDAIAAAAYTVRADSLDALASDPDVLYVSPDRPVSPTGLAADYKLQGVLADLAQQYGWTGSGVGVAVIDSGVQDKPDLHTPGYRVVYGQNIPKGGSAVDVYGHGTHVAGIIGGNGGQSKGVNAGVAPLVNLINLQVLDKTGSGSDSSVIAAIQRAIQLQSTYNIRVINLSLGRPVFESYKLDPLCLAVEAAWKAGIVVVVAAGNEGRNDSAGTAGYGTITAPGNDPYVITVGAMKTGGTASRSDDYIATYSSKGPTLLDHIVKPDIVAPGNRIVSVLGNNTIAGSSLSTLSEGAYLVLSGTSMATGMVSGAAALLLQAQPKLTPDQVKARLMKTAYKSFPMFSVATDPVTGQLFVSYYDIFTIGAGYLDVYAALHNSDLSTGYALSPTAVYDPWTQSFTLAGTPDGSGKETLWTTDTLWGSWSLWGSRSLWGTSTVWGDSAVIDGTRSLWGSRSLWGNTANPIWGTRSLWGTSSTTTTESSRITLNGEN